MHDRSFAIEVPNDVTLFHFLDTTTSHVNSIQMLPGSYGSENKRCTVSFSRPLDKDRAGGF